MRKLVFLTTLILVLFGSLIWFYRTLKVVERPAGCSLNVTIFCQRGHEDLCNEVKRNVTIVFSEMKIKSSIYEEWSDLPFVVYSTRTEKGVIVVKKPYAITIKNRYYDIKNLKDEVKSLCED